MIAVRTTSADATRDVGAALAGLARPGDVIVLAGDLGAGKTALAQGFGRGLGVTEQITSPTFVIARAYEGRIRLNHLDVYRLDTIHEAEDVGIAELVDDDAVTLVEWGEAVAPVLTHSYLRLRLTFGEGEDDRTIEIDHVGGGWAARDRALTEALRPWAAPAAVGGES